MVKTRKNTGCLNTTTKYEAVKPIVKWTGGKSQLLKHISPEMPKEYNNFIDPFFGGGAVPFALVEPSRLIFNDANSRLIDVYLAVRANVDKVIDTLKELISHYPGSAGYYSQREVYNKDYGKDLFLDVARFLYLNKRCFNGLYRLNRKGEFNVPYGHQERPFPFEDLLAVSQYLSEVRVGNLCYGDYKKMLNVVREGDLVFLDPPYIEDGHGATNQMYGGCSISYDEFVDFVDKINDRGALFILTNNAVDEVFNRFSRYNIKMLDNVKRSFRPNGSDRRGKEVVIKNF